MNDYCSFEFLDYDISEQILRHSYQRLPERSIVLRTKRKDLNHLMHKFYVFIYLFFCKKFKQKLFFSNKLPKKGERKNRMGRKIRIFGSETPYIGIAAFYCDSM